MPDISELKKYKNIAEKTISTLNTFYDLNRVVPKITKEITGRSV